MPELIGVIAALIVVAIVIEVSHFAVYGWFIKESELDTYLGKYLPKATLNPYSDHLISDMPQYVARSQSILAKWQVQDYGVIPRWSKWSKTLDKKCAELLAERPANFKVPLSQL